MNTKILDKKINKVSGYNLYLTLGIFIFSLMVVVIIMQIAGVLDGEDEEIIRLASIGITSFSVLLIIGVIFLMFRKKDYTKILNVDAEEVARIVEDTNNLELDVATFALGHNYAYFYGEVIRTPRKLVYATYDNIAYAKFVKDRSNEQILFYDQNDAWIATVSGYKKKSEEIKSILSSKGVLIE